MKKRIFYVAASILALNVCSLKAQSFSDFISSVTSNDVVSAVTGGAKLSPQTVQGHWNFTGTAVELSSDNFASKAAGAVVTSQLEEKLNKLCNDAGIKAGLFAFVFNPDMTFTSNIGKRDIGGTYSINAETNEITLNYGIYNKINFGKITANVTLAGNKMSILFPADKLLKLVTKIASYTNNASVKAIAALADQYDGIKLGAELTTDTVKPESTASAAQSAISAIGKLF